MTFKQLANELMEQGWRCYYLPDIERLTRGDNLQKFATRFLIQIQVYEGRNIVFVKNSKPVDK